MADKLYVTANMKKWAIHISMNILLILLLLFTSFFTNLYPCKAEAGSTSSYFEDFESGSGFWLRSVTGNGIAERVLAPAYAHSGSYSGHQICPDGQSTSAGIIPCPSGYTEYTIEGWIYIKQRTDLFASSMIGFIIANAAVGWSPYSDNGSYAYPGGAYYSYQKPVGLPKNSWHNVKVTYYATDATFSIWVDGTILHNHIQSNMNPGQTPQYYAGQAGSSGTNKIIEQYTDDITVSPAPTCTTGPVVTTSNISLIDNDSQTTLCATGQGSLTCLGNAPYAQVSFEYWTSDNPTINYSQRIQTQTATGPFTDNLTSLSYDKTYIYRAKAMIYGSTFYGDNITFYSVPSWRANIQPGDILYSYPGTKPSLLNIFADFCAFIRSDIKHKYWPKASWNATALISHTALYVGDNSTIEARPNHKILGIPYDPGVYKTDIKDWDSYHENKDNVTLLRLKSTGDPIKDLTYKTQAVNFATKQIPPDSAFLHYDIEAYLEGNKNQCILSPTGSWYCSELVWASYWYGGQGINIESSRDIPDGVKILCEYWDPIFPTEIKNSPRLEDKGHHLRPDLAAVESKMVFVMSPVDIIIVTPDGHTIKKGYSDLAGASYDELDIDGDGNTESIIYIPGIGVGNYSINIIPHAGANPSETYSIFFADSQTGTYIFPCIDTAISDIPKQGYVVNWNGNKFTSTEDNSIITPPTQQITSPHSSAQISPPPPQLPIALPNIIVQSASLSTTKVTPDSPVTVNATVINRGTVNSTIKIKLYINGQEETSESITVTSGGIKPVSFTISRNQPGTYTVYVGGTSAGSFIVDEFADPNIILYISLSAIFLAFVLGLIIIVRRKSY